MYIYISFKSSAVNPTFFCFILCVTLFLLLLLFTYPAVLFCLSLSLFDAVASCRCKALTHPQGSIMFHLWMKAISCTPTLKTGSLTITSNHKVVCLGLSYPAQFSLVCSIKGKSSLLFWHLRVVSWRHFKHIELNSSEMGEEFGETEVFFLSPCINAQIKRGAESLRQSSRGASWFLILRQVRHFAYIINTKGWVILNSCMKSQLQFWSSAYGHFYVIADR